MWQLFICHGGQQKGKAVSKQRLAHWIVESPWRTNLKASCALWGCGPTPLGVLPPPMRWRMASLWQTPAELRAGRHRISSQDSTVSALSQSLPVCWVTGNRGRWWEGGKNWPVSHLQRHSPSPRGYERLFYPPVQFPGR